MSDKKSNTGIAVSKLAWADALPEAKGTGEALTGISGKISGIKQKNLYLVIPTPKPFYMSTTTPNTFTDSHAINLLASGLSEQVSIEPLVALYRDTSIENSYRLLIHLYIPDGVAPQLNLNFDDVELQDTEAGYLELRQIHVDYATPPPRTTTFSLWEIRATYTVEGKNAQAIRVRYVVGDPKTSRGTVTSVATS